VLKAILTDPEATLPSAADGRLRNPILHVTGLARALGLTAANPSQFMYLLGGLGQSVLTPVSVFGFYSPLAPLPGHPGHHMYADLYGRVPLRYQETSHPFCR